MNTPALLAVEGLCVQATGPTSQTLLKDVSFTLHPGEVLILLGESGAGKSLLAQAVMGNLPTALTASGRITLNGKTSAADTPPARRAAWGRLLTLLPQEPSLALDPLMRLAPQLAEVHRLVRGLPHRASQTVALQALQAIGLPHAAQQYPWQLSGGMAQRAAAAVAQAGGARIVLADEPTKGLDAHWRDHTIDLLQQVQQAGGCAVVITHDLRVAQALGGRLIVLRAGEVVEQGDTHQVLANPQHPFTRQLLEANPAHWHQRPVRAVGQRVLSTRGVQKSFGERVLFSHIDLRMHAGQTLVVQGPSGSGKSTLGNVLLGLLPPDQGRVTRAPGLDPTAFQKLYQDPVASFAPQRRLGDALRDAARLHGCPWLTVQHRLARLGVAESLLLRRPAEVSGGELQRLALARVLVAQPALLFADEPTSRLDPLSQQQAMGVLLNAVDETGCALVLVTHDEDLARAAGGQQLRLGAPPAEPTDSAQSPTSAV